MTSSPGGTGSGSVIGETACVSEGFLQESEEVAAMKTCNEYEVTLPLAETAKSVCTSIRNSGSQSLQQVHHELPAT